MRRWRTLFPTPYSGCPERDPAALNCVILHGEKRCFSGSVRCGDAVIRCFAAFFAQAAICPTKCPTRSPTSKAKRQSAPVTVGGCSKYTYARAREDRISSSVAIQPKSDTGTRQERLRAGNRTGTRSGIQKRTSKPLNQHERTITPTELAVLGSVGKDTRAVQREPFGWVWKPAESRIATAICFAISRAGKHHDRGKRR